MAYKVTVSFSGVISASKGKVIEINDSALADDLLKAGYIIPFEADKPKTKAIEPKTEEIEPKTKADEPKTEGDKPKTTKRKGK